MIENRHGKQNNNADAMYFQAWEESGEGTEVKKEYPDVLVIVGEAVRPEDLTAG